MHTILYIDDDTHYVHLIDKYLSAHGYSVETAKDEHEGVRKARELQPDLILLDLYLPRATGLDVITQLREEVSTWNIPVVVLSDLPIPQSRQLTAGAGVQEFVPKPCRARQLIGAVRRHVARRACVSSDMILH